MNTGNSASFLISGGLLFDGASPPRDGLGLLMERGRVVRIAPRGEFQGFSGRHIDTTGCTVLPGLIDCHVHLHATAEGDQTEIHRTGAPAELTLRILENAQSTLLGGITTVRDQGGKDYHELPVRDAINSGRHLAATIKSCGRIITMTGGHGHVISIEADGVDAVVKAVRLNIKAGVDHIKVMATGGVMTPLVDPLAAHLTAEELAAAARIAKMLGKPIAAHAEGADGIRNSVRAGFDSVEHGFELNDATIEEMIAAGTWLVPTLSAPHNMINGTQPLQPHVKEKVDRFHERHRASFKAYVRSGGKIAMGTDAGTPGNYHGENAQELALMVECGLPPLRALIAATSSAADLLRIPDSGRLKEGSVADLLIVDGDPSVDITRVADRQHHRMVVKRGFDVVTNIGNVAMRKRTSLFSAERTR